MTRNLHKSVSVSWNQHLPNVIFFLCFIECPVLCMLTQKNKDFYFCSFFLPFPRHIQETSQIFWTLSIATYQSILQLFIHLIKSYFLALCGFAPSIIHTVVGTRTMAVKYIKLFGSSRNHRAGRRQRETEITRMVRGTKEERHHLLNQWQD